MNIPLWPPLRSALERVSRGVVLERRLPRRYGGGRIFVTPDAALRFWRWDLEACDPLLFQLVDELIRPGMTVWDVGSNVGLFSLASAAVCGPKGGVVSIEPDAFLVELQGRSVRLLSDRSAPVRSFCCAVANQMGTAELKIAARGRSSNHLTQVQGSTQTGGVRETRSVVTITLDWLLSELSAPHVVKIDVEGAEALVLEGASTVLRTARPTLLFEGGADPAAVADLLRRADYVMLDAAQLTHQRRPMPAPCWDTLAVPAERV
jgi:FkbM family methyltransferase